MGNGSGRGLPTVRVYEDGGRWRARAYFGRDRLTGRAVRRSRTLDAIDRAGAEAEAAEWLRGLADAGSSMDAAGAVGAWLDAFEAKGARPGTVAKYRAAYRNHIRPRFAGVPLAEVGAGDIEAFEVDMLRGRGKRRPLSVSTVRTVHFVLKGAFGWAVKMGRIGWNPADAVAPPRAERSRALALDPADLAKLSPALDAALAGEGAGTARGAALAAAWLMLHCGMRCGEACGLTVRDVRTGAGEAPRVTVSGAVRDAPGGPVRVPRAKTDGSIRSVALSPADAEALRGYIAVRGLAASPASPVATVSGSLASPAYVSRLFRSEARALGLPPWVHAHTLRHTYASIALAAGVDVYTLAEAMGHASPSTTLNTYAHMMPGRDGAAAVAISDALERLAAGGADA